MATAEEVDDAVLALLGRDDLSAEEAALFTAWGVWGTWANGGFEGVLTGGLADDRERVLAALCVVGADAEAALFEQALYLLDGDMESRNEGWGASPEVRHRAAVLDEAMTGLPDFKEAVLGPFLDGMRRPDSGAP